MTEPGNSTEKTKYSFEIEDRPIRSEERDHDREYKSMRESIESIEATGQNKKHPLDGVPGFEKLPTLKKLTEVMIERYAVLAQLTHTLHQIL